MSVKKGDLVLIDPQCFNESFLLPDNFFKIDKIDKIFMCVVKGPYENLITYEVDKKKFSTVFIAADLTYQDYLLKGIPIRYLKRVV